MKIDDLYIFEILIHFYPNLVIKLAKISPKMVVKNDVIFGEAPPPVISRHKPMTSFVNDPLVVQSYFSDHLCSIPVLSFSFPMLHVSLLNRSA